MDPTWLTIASTAAVALSSFVASILAGFRRSRATKEVDALAESRSIDISAARRPGRRISVAGSVNVAQSAALADPSIAEEYLRNHLASQRENGAPDGAE